LLSAVEQVQPVPDWILSQLRLRGIGGSRQLTGGQHVLSNLDLQFAAGQSLRSQQYTMNLNSIAGLGQNLRGVAMGLGDPRVVTRPDTLTGLPENIAVSSQLFLHDLRADRLDADSVRVDVGSLKANGRVRVTVHQYGASTFKGHLRVVLFRDRDGDLRYTEGSDEPLGVQPLDTVAPGQDVFLDFPIQNLSRYYPEEIYVAWLDADTVSPERHVGDHTTLGGNACQERKSMVWTVAAPDSIALPTVSATILPVGAPMLGVHLRDTDHDGLVRPNDSLDLLWYYAGKVCVAKPGSDTSWCRSAPSVGSNSDLTVRDVDGDGVPEILAGREIFRQNGSVFYDLDHPGVTTLADLDEDGFLDTLRIQGACTQAISGVGTIFWASTGCTTAGTYQNLAGISRHPMGCVDASLSGVTVLAQGIQARFANAGTVELPSGLPVRVLDAQGNEKVRVLTSSSLLPGQWVDVWIPTTAVAGDVVEIPTQSLRDLGYLELQTTNNRRPAFGSAGGTQP
jgi:hypothetical protein